MNNTIVQLEDPLNSIVKITGRPSKVKKSSKTKKQSGRTTLLTPNSLINSGYQSDVDTPDDKKVSKPKKKVLRKKRTPKLKVSNPTKLPSVGKVNKVGKSSKLTKRVNFSKYLKSSSKTKKSTKRRLRNIENNLNITSGYESDKEEESVIDDMPKLPNMSLNNINIRYKDFQSNQDTQIDTTSTSKSMTKSFIYQSKLQNGKFTEEGEYAINNSNKPYYIEGIIKDGKIMEKMVKK